MDIHHKGRRPAIIISNQNGRTNKATFRYYVATIKTFTRHTVKKYFAFIALLMVIVFLYTGKDTKQHDQTSTYPLFKVQCKNTSIPSFTLNYDSNPSEDEVATLCTCIWDKFVKWEKETAIKLTSGEQNTINAVYMGRFPSIFGARINECGGDKL